MLNREPSELQRLLGKANDADILSLALGLPSEEVLPFEELAEAAAETLRGGARSLQYGPAENELKSHIVELMRIRGVRCSEDEVFLTTGAQQALTLLARLLVPHGGSILVEDAVYPGFRQAVAFQEPHLVPIPTDPANGFDIERAGQTRRNPTKPAFLYTMSAGHNPLGINTTERHKQALVEFARSSGTFIVEDDVYGLLQYGESFSPPLRRFDAHSVFYVGSFSKIIAPAVRVGWLISPREHITTLSVIKEGLDINTATTSQRIVRRYLCTHSVEDRIARLRSHYRSRCEAMEDALSRHAPSGTTWRKPQSGFFYWVENQGFGDTGSLLETALANGVSFVPGRAFSVGRCPRHKSAMRLSFSHCAQPLLAEAVRRIAESVEQTNRALARKPAQNGRE